MLFDLRGRGRRRTVQAIYISLAVLMGGGLVFFGIGGNTSGGLLDAINGTSSSSANSYQKQVKALEQRLQVNPRDQGSLLKLTRVNFQAATASGQNYDQNTGTYSAKGRQALGRASAAWRRYLALDPSKPDPNVARLMVQAYGALGQYDNAVDAQQVLIEGSAPSPALYAQLSIIAYAAKQVRKSTLAQEKAESLATSPTTRKALRAQIVSNKQAIDQSRIQQATQQQGSAPSLLPNGSTPGLGGG